MNNFIRHLFTSGTLVVLGISVPLCGDLVRDVNRLLASGKAAEQVCQEIGSWGFKLNPLAPKTKEKITQTCEVYFLDVDGTASFAESVHNNKINVAAWYATTDLPEYRTTLTPITQQKINLRAQMLQNAHQRRDLLQSMRTTNQ